VQHRRFIYLGNHDDLLRNVIGRSSRESKEYQDACLLKKVPGDSKSFSSECAA
jgi:hypothetical protein